MYFPGEGLTNADAKRANDIGVMMNLAGFNENDANNVASGTVLGPNSNGLRGFLVQSHNLVPASSAVIPNGAFAATAQQQYPLSMLMNMNSFNNHPSPLMVNDPNMQTRHAMQQQQPQIIYHRSPYIPPHSGYYYNHNHNEGGSDHSVAHLFSDDYTGSTCSIM
ncbi:hypothetical protein Lalb_Chr21g0308471 [Lupinus albus]|uniref:Uncharacterized protein n=1 Tax=Lupinus albus TaxID=3870 RepID=A0A6A4N556_LUPAL|nr:hypothetical protein Lalb_Chr21g0308471 [Lupinus albus]